MNNQENILVFFNNFPANSKNFNQLFKFKINAPT